MQSNNDDAYSFIYSTINLINNKKYIGKHTNFNDIYFGSGKLLMQDLKKYGKNNFIRITLAIAYSEAKLNKLEIFFIHIFNVVKDPNFYNIHIGRNGCNTRIGHSDIKKQQYAEKMRQISLANNYLRINKSRTEEEKYNISMGCKKYWVNISEQKKQVFKEIMHNVVLGEKNPNYGHKWSDEKRQLLSEKLKKQNHSKGIKNSNYGKYSDKTLNGKTVYMYDLNFNLIRQFNTKQQVLDFLNIKNHVQLNKVIKNRTIYRQYY